MRWLGLSVFVVLLDQITKYAAQSSLVYAEPLAVLPWFNLTLLYNRGAAFSFLSDAAGWQRWFFTLVAIVAIALLTNWLRKLRHEQYLLGLSLSLVIGGAAGNLVDRVLFGHVIDFIQVYYQSFYWPAFNLADSAITAGAALLIWESLRASPEKS